MLSLFVIMHWFILSRLFCKYVYVVFWLRDILALCILPRPSDFCFVFDSLPVYFERFAGNLKFVLLLGNKRFCFPFFKVIFCLVIKFGIQHVDAIWDKYNHRIAVPWKPNRISHNPFRQANVYARLNHLIEKVRARLFYRNKFETLEKGLLYICYRL